MQTVEINLNPDTRTTLYSGVYGGILGTKAAEYFQHRHRSGTCRVAFYKKYGGYNAECILEAGEEKVTLHFGFMNEKDLEGTIADLKTKFKAELSDILTTLSIRGTQTMLEE